MEVATQLGALLYYQHPKKKDGKDLQFEQLESKSKNMHIVRAKGIISMIGKLNLELTPVRDKEKERQLAMQNVENLAAFIEKFVRDKVTHPQGVADMFPFRELALQILK